MTLWYTLFLVVFLFATAVQLRPAKEANSTAVASTSYVNTTTTSSPTTAHDDDRDAHNSSEMSDDLSQDSNSSDVDTTQSKTKTTTLSSTSPSSVSSSSTSSSSVSSASRSPPSLSSSLPSSSSVSSSTSPSSVSSSSTSSSSVSSASRSPPSLSSSLPSSSSLSSSLTSSASVSSSSTSSSSVSSSSASSSSVSSSSTSSSSVSSSSTSSSSSSSSTSSPPSSIGKPGPLLALSANIASLQLPSPENPGNASYAVATPPHVIATTTRSTSSTLAPTSTDSAETLDASEDTTASDNDDRYRNETSTTVGPSEDSDEEDDEDDEDDDAKEKDDDDDLSSTQNSTSTLSRTTPRSSKEDNSKEDVSHRNPNEIYLGSSQGVERATNGDQDLTMECNFTSGSVDGIRVAWFRHGMQIFSRSHSRFRITTKKLEDQRILYAQLRITCVLMLDTGPYTCVASRGPEVAVHNFSLVVYDSAKLLIYPPTLSVLSRHQKAVFWCKLLNPDDVMTSSKFEWQVNGVAPNKVFPPLRGVIERNDTIEFYPRGEVGNCTCFVGRSHDTAHLYVISRGMKTCPDEIDKHGLIWPTVPAGREAIAYCPVHHTGQATRRCGADGQWAEPANLLDCVLDSLKDIDSQVQGIVDGTGNITVGTVLEGLLTIACNGSECEQLDGAGNLDKTVDILDKVTAIEDADVTQNDAEAFSSVLDALLDKRKGQDWNRVTQRDKRKPTRLLLSVRRIGRSAGRHLPPNASLPIHKANVDILVSRISYRDLVFPEYSAERISWMFLHADSLEKIAETFIYPEENSSTTKDLLYTAACYKTIASLLPNYTAEGQGSDDLTINSEVLSLSFGANESTIDLLRPLVLHFKNTDVNLTRPVCSFWDFNAENEGEWSNSGCELDEDASNSTDTVCRCHHLTNFAVLMSPYRSSTLDDTNDTALSIITYIGCALSILGCLVTFVVYLRLWSYLKSARAHLLMQLCAVLIVFYLIFLAGVERTSNADTCRAVALVLHFLLLVAFFLMLALGIEIAVTVTYVFSATRSKLCYLILLAWGFPLAIVCVSAGVTQLDGYGGDICWLSLKSGLLYAFVGPALLVIVANTVIVGIVLRAIYSTAVMINKTKQEKIKAGVRSICVLLPSMGLTWVFGILAVNEKTVVFEYIFAFCNCLQGVFIFLFYCLLNSSVREGVQRLRQRHEVSKNVYSDDAKGHKSVKSLFSFRSSKNAERAASDSDNSSKLSLNLSSSVPGESSDAPNTANLKQGYPQDSPRYGNSWSEQPPDFPVPGSDYSARASDRTEPANRHRTSRVSFYLPRYSDVCGSGQQGGSDAKPQRNTLPRENVTRRRSGHEQSD